MCGATIEIFENGKRIPEGSLPFVAEEYYKNLPLNVPTPIDGTEDVS